jgi:hypothetical protein
MPVISESRPHSGTSILGVACSTARRIARCETADTTSGPFGRNQVDARQKALSGPPLTPRAENFKSARTGKFQSGVYGEGRVLKSDGWEGFSATSQQIETSKRWGKLPDASAAIG